MSDSSGIRAPDCYRRPAYRLIVELPSTKRHFLNHRLNNFPHSFNVNNIPGFFCLFWIRKMGKKENIKRAKKLKEAKRRREQDAMIASGTGPSSAAIKQRISDSTFIVNKGKIKYSELLQKFVEPFLDKNDDFATIKSKYTFALTAWNAAIIREKDTETFHMIKKDLNSLTSNDPAIEEIFDEMVQRKEEKFSEYKKSFADFEIKKLRASEYDLTVAVFESEEESDKS